MRNLFIALLAALTLFGCGTVRKIESGNTTVGERLVLRIDGAWNHIDFPGIKPAQLWTMEGAPVDELLIYSGVKDGEAMHGDGPNPGRKAKVSFRSTMQIDELVAMFESVLTQDDSSFKLLKVEPYPFAGGKGFRFEYERARKVDNVVQSGIAFGVVDRKELYAMVYQAPRKVFFPRHKARIEAMAGSAALK